VSIDKALEVLEASGANLRFRQLLRLCACFFGEPRIRGSHHIFKTPWPGNRLNLQAEGSHAKRYQVDQVIRALRKLQEEGH
jgi:hypothetical protein